jgi:hypothetical protein
MATRNVNFTRGSTDDVQRAYQLADALTVRALRSREPPMSPWEGVAQLGEAAIAALQTRSAQRLADAERERITGANENLIRQLTDDYRPSKINPDGSEIPGTRAPDLLDVETGRPMLINDRANALAAAMAGSDPADANRALGGAVMQKMFTGPKVERVDVGDRILILEDGRQVGVLPKGATPDAALREEGADRRHVTPSGSAVLGEQGANYRHQTPSGSARLSADVAVRGQDIGAINAAAAREQALALADPRRQAIIDQAQRDAKQRAGAEGALAIINEAEPLIDKATGSYVGAGTDLAARAFGGTTEGATTIAQLKTLQAALMMKLPRMEGPQSNYDVQLYREAAGQSGDPTVPRAQKKAALDTIRALQEKYAGMEPGSSRPSGASGSWEPRPGDKYLGGQ